MASKWMVCKLGAHTSYKRIMRASRGYITGSVWYEGTYRRYRWMASSGTELRFGWSRSLAGAQRACSRAMHVMRRWMDEQGR